MSEQEKIEFIARTALRQHQEATKILEDALDDSDLSSDVYCEVRGICRLMMNIALQQRDERDAIYKVIHHATPAPKPVPGIQPL